jgi:hypothetical protein
MKKTLTIGSAFITAAVYAGGSIGGSNPPALQDTYMSPAPPEAGALFTGDDGRISLGTRSELRDELLLSKVRIQPQTLEISESDFSLLASPERAKTLEVINLDQKIQGRSYWIEDGNTSNEILLIDRRDTIRSNVR